MANSSCWSGEPPSPGADQFVRRTVKCELQLGLAAHGTALELTIVGCNVW
jgi:hypothetical protein